MASLRILGDAEASEDGGRLSKDLVFTMLKNSRRRNVLHYLNQRDERVTVRELSRQVAAWENGIDLDELEYSQRKRVYTSLYQTHLPKLNDADIVDYDRDRGTVALGEAAWELDVYMEAVPTKGVSCSVYSLGLAALSLLLVPFVWLDVFPFAGVPDVALAAFVALVFVASAGLQTYSPTDGCLWLVGPSPTAPAAVEDAGEDR